ncbi:MAG: hypothetical protein IKQ45_06465 [Clostridia bacterium]|nr:hypothetical protein [Clostridia bacterium]
MKNSMISCVICGEKFVPSTPNAKYCSPECAETGQNARRREWEQRTGYLEKKRRQAQERRNAIKAAAQAEKDAAARQAAEERQRLGKERIEVAQNALIQSIERGEPLARMRVYPPNTLEYWEAYRDYDISYAESIGKRCYTTVNDIYVTDADFPNLMIISIRELGQIREDVRHV